MLIPVMKEKRKSITGIINGKPKNININKNKNPFRSKISLTLCIEYGRK